jgi:hypothetical protein
VEQCHDVVRVIELQSNPAEHNQTLIDLRIELGCLTSLIFSAPLSEDYSQSDTRFRVGLSVSIHSRWFLSENNKVQAIENFIRTIHLVIRRDFWFSMFSESPIWMVRAGLVFSRYNFFVQFAWQFVDRQSHRRENESSQWYKILILSWFIWQRHNQKMRWF